jgi:hypothetical protein
VVATGQFGIELAALKTWMATGRSGAHERSLGAMWALGGTARRPAMAKVSISPQWLVVAAGVLLSSPFAVFLGWFIGWSHFRRLWPGRKVATGKARRGQLRGRKVSLRELCPNPVPALGFNVPYDISYRGLKPLSIYKELRHIRLRRMVDLPQVVHRGVED